MSSTVVFPFLVNSVTIFKAIIRKLVKFENFPRVTQVSPLRNALTTFAHWNQHCFSMSVLLRPLNTPSNLCKGKHLLGREKSSL